VLFSLIHFSFKCVFDLSLQTFLEGLTTAGTLAARFSMRHCHWRRLSSRAAADKGNKTSGSRTSSSSLSLYTDDDLQNNQKHSKQLILVFVFLVHGFVCFHFGFAFLLVSPSSLFQEAAWRMGFY
jgi:nitrate reductase gamma subunit